MNIIKEQLQIDETIKNKIESECKFLNVKPTYENGSVINIAKTNIAYVTPHKVIIKDLIFLVFNGSSTLFFGNLENSINFNDFRKLISIT